MKIISFRNALFVASLSFASFSWWYTHRMGGLPGAKSSVAGVKTGPQVAMALNEPAQKTPSTREADDASRVRAIIDRAPRDSRGVPLVHIEELLAYLPELRNRFESALVAHRRLEYGLFVNSEGLTPDEQARFFQIITAREDSWIQNCVRASEQGLGLKAPEIDDTLKADFAQGETDLKALLGEDRYQALQTYRLSADARNRIGGLNSVVIASYDTGEPISQSDFIRLSETATKAGLYRDGKLNATATGLPIDQLMNNANKFLTPDQLEVLGLSFDAQQITLATSNIVRDRMKAAGELNQRPQPHSLPK